VQQTHDLSAGVYVVRGSGVLDEPVCVFEDVVGLHPALGGPIVIRARHAHATELVLGARLDTSDEQRLGDRV
jgi:hypothetical protein